MVRPRRPPRRPLTQVAALVLRAVLRTLYRLGLGGPLWAPPAVAGAVFVLAILVPLSWGGEVALSGPGRSLAEVLALGVLLATVAAWPARYRRRRRPQRRQAAQ